MTNTITISGREGCGSTTAALLTVAGLVARECRAGRRPHILMVAFRQHWADVHRRTLESECQFMGAVSAVAGYGGDYVLESISVERFKPTGVRYDFVIVDGLPYEEAHAFVASNSIYIDRAFVVPTIVQRIPSFQILGVEVGAPELSRTS